MSTAPGTVESRCLCGGAKCEIPLPTNGTLLQAYICSCTSCRRLTGGLCLTVVFLGSNWAPPPSLLEKVVSFEFSPRIQQYHCKTCGTILFARVLPAGDRPCGETRYGVSTGSLAGADGVFEIVGFEYLHDTLDGGISDLLPTVSGSCLERWPDNIRQGEEIPFGWRSPKVNEVRPSPSDKLHAHCKCGGVNFWISRPSKRSFVGEAPVPDALRAIVQGSESVPSSARKGLAWWLCEGGTKFLAGICPCNSCRLDSGNEWAQWAFVPVVDISLDPEGEVPFMHNPFGTLKTYQSSKNVTRYHCGVCGASVFWDGNWVGREQRQLIDVAVGLLDAPEGSRAENWLEWQTGRLSFREDAISRAKSLTLGLEAGLEAYGRKRDAGKSP